MNSSKRNAVAVVSENDVLRRFLELELSNLGAEVFRARNAEELTARFSLIFTDNRAVVSSQSLYGCPVVFIGSQADEGADNEYFLEYPTPIDGIREAYFGLSGLDVNTVTACSDEGQTTVYVLDEKNGRLLLDGCNITVSKKEYAVLSLLCSADGADVGREQIMSSVGTHNGNIADVYICRLRKKLEAPNGKRLIFTERGTGYRTDLKLKKA